MRDVNKFDVRRLMEKTSNLPVAGFYNSWRMVIRLLLQKFNSLEIEALLSSKIVTKATTGFVKARKATTADLSKYLDLHGITSGSKIVNELVMKRFGKEMKLELNDQGQPCRRGTMPGNYDPNKTVLVPVGTPLCCDPTSETYWSM